MTHPTDEFSSIEPIQKLTKFRGKEVIIKPLTVGQIPKFARAIHGKLLADICNFGANSSIGALVMVDLIAEHGEKIIEAVSVASGIPADEVEQAEMDDLILLATTIVQVNSDFFAKRLTQTLAGAMQAVNGAGLTQ